MAEEILECMPHPVDEVDAGIFPIYNVIPISGSGLEIT